MAASRPEQRSKPGRARRAEALTRAEAEYRASIVTLEAICHFVRANGAGDRAAAWVAAQQLALITYTQLIAAGLDKDAIAVRCRRGGLHRVHRSVYLLGSPIMVPGARELAGVLACGPTAVVSHRSAAASWGLVPASSTDVEVTVVGRRRRSRRGLVIRRVRHLDPRDKCLLRGIPITSPARTALDFASEASGDELETALAEGRVHRLLSDPELRAAIARAPYRPGSAALSSAIAREGGPRWTESEAERELLRLIRGARLPTPRTQVRVAGWPADFLWPENKLIVEVDGYRFHGHRAAFERDRKRDAAHVLAGYRVIRVTWRQLTEEPLAVVATIARALVAAGTITAS